MVISILVEVEVEVKVNMKVEKKRRPYLLFAGDSELGNPWRGNQILFSIYYLFTTLSAALF